MSEEVMDVTPHPRVLGVFGELKVPAVNCLAELVDNAFDDFLRAGQPTSDDVRPTVTIALPGTRSTRREGEVWVSDNGRGMDFASLNNAIRAGWTSNDRYGALGLYGVGFNIATAGLGRLAEIRTSRAGDPSWIVVTLDIAALSRGGHYQVPVRHDAKDDPSEHGTRVVIKDLHEGQYEFLKSHAKSVRDKLGDLYSFLLSEKRFLITVGRTAVRPRLPCLWGADRSVTRNGVEIPAVIPIDHPLPARLVCLDCGRSNVDDAEKCEYCGAERLNFMERRVRGWLGIQRYVDKNDYGVDFLRNGRKILLRDKQIFHWVDPEGLAEPDLEYPIDNPRGEGRIVGEIHCDHVPVNFTKTTFDMESAEWKSILRVLRGDSPLQPKKAKSLGYPVNTHPLGLLFTGYRRDTPGLNYLCAPREKAREWAARFRNPTETSDQFNSDELWYEAAYQVDNPPESLPDDDVRDDLLGKLGLDDTEPADSPDGSPRDGHSTSPDPRDAEPKETLDQRLQRYRDAATKVADLEGKYQADGHGPLELTVWAVRGQRLLDLDDKPVSIWVHQVRAPLIEAFVDVEDPLFTEYGVDLRDLTLVELAEWIRAGTRIGSSPPKLSTVLADLKRSSSAQRLTADELANHASDLLDRIREAMLSQIQGAPTAYWDMVQEPERDATKQRFALDAADVSWDSVVEGGEFILYAPASAVVRILERRPEAFLGGQVFKRNYESDEGIRSLIVSRLVGYVSDLALLERHRPKRLSADELTRSRLSCRLIERELSDAN